MWTTIPVDDPAARLRFLAVFIEKRKTEGHSQRSLAKLLSLGHSTIARFERGESVGTHALRIMYLWVYPIAELPACPCVICRGMRSSFTQRQLREIDKLVDEKLQSTHGQCVSCRNSKV